MSARFSEAEAAEIDTARGTEERGVWIRRAVLAAVERQQPPVGHADRQAEAVRQNHAAAKGDCRHPPNRRIGNYCGACQRTVGKP